MPWIAVSHCSHFLYQWFDDSPKLKNAFGLPYRRSVQPCRRGSNSRPQASDGATGFPCLRDLTLSPDCRGLFNRRERGSLVELGSDPKSGGKVTTHWSDEPRCVFPLFA